MSILYVLYICSQYYFTLCKCKSTSLLIKNTAPPYAATLKTFCARLCAWEVALNVITTCLITSLGLGSSLCNSRLISSLNQTSQGCSQGLYFSFYIHAPRLHSDYSSKTGGTQVKKTEMKFIDLNIYCR